MASTKYKIINTTVKKPELDSSGRDRRKMSERVGYCVQFRVANGALVKVFPNRPCLTNDVTDGMWRLQRGGFIKIEEVDDVTSVLQKHRYHPEKGDAVGQLLAPDENTIHMASHASATPRARASATEMGKEIGAIDAKKAAQEGAEYGAVNPDGNPNFVVTATKDVKRKQRFEPKETSAEPTA